MNFLYTRRSVRKFADRPVEKNKIIQILKAAMQAPSAANQQGWEFIVVQDPNLLQQVAQISPYARLAASAPAAVVVLGNLDFMTLPENREQDLGAATQNLLLEAVNMNLGAVWLGVAPVKDRMSRIREIFSLPEHVEPFNIVALGYPEDENANHFTDRFDDRKIHFDGYKSSSD